MKQNLKDFLINLAISMCIGLFVGVVQIIVINMSEETVELLIMCSIIGGVIGTISRFVFMYLVEIKEISVMVGYISVFITIAAISCLPSFYYDFIRGSFSSMKVLVSILITAELLGMSFCYYSYKRYLVFNSKLIGKKRQLLIKS